MSAQTATIREWRTDFRSVKRKIEHYGGIVITDHGEPAYLLQPLRPKARANSPPPDYYARLRRRQPVYLAGESSCSPPTCVCLPRTLRILRSELPDLR